MYQVDIIELVMIRLKQLHKYKAKYDEGCIDDLFIDTMIEIRNRLLGYAQKK